MYSYGPPHMAGQKQDDQLEHTFSSYVRIRDVALKTCQRRWTIGRSGERGSGISALVVQHDDDDDDSLSERLPSSVGLGHTSVCRAGQYMDLTARCVLVLLAVGQGCLTWILVGQHSCWACQDQHPQGSGSNLPWWVLDLSPSARGTLF